MPRGDRRRDGRRARGMGRYRRDHHRQGARPLRGRDDAGADAGRRPRRRGQAAAACPHRRFGRRFHRDRGDRARAVRTLPARARGVVGEAVRVECDVGAEPARALRRARRRRGRRPLRPARPLVHRDVRRPARHRREGRGQGSPGGRSEPPRAPAPTGHHRRAGDGRENAVGPDPLRRDLPVLRRRLGDRHRRCRRRAGGRERGPRRRLDPRDVDAHGGRNVLRPQPPQPARGARRGRRAVGRGGDRRPARGDRCRRDLRPVLVVRADVAGEPRLLRRGGRVEACRRGCDSAGRRPPRQPLRRRAQLEPHRRLRDAALRRGGTPGDGPRGRAPDLRRPPRGRPRLRRREPIFLDVGGGSRATR